MNGVKPSAKDDMISMFYLGVFLIQKDLPWSDFVDCMPCKDKYETTRLIVEEKKKLKLSDLCINEIPSQFMEIANIIENSSPNQLPNYNRIKELLHSAMDDQLAK